MVSVPLLFLAVGAGALLLVILLVAVLARK